LNGFLFNIIYISRVRYDLPILSLVLRTRENIGKSSYTREIYIILNGKPFNILYITKNFARVGEYNSI